MSKNRLREPTADPKQTEINEKLFWIQQHMSKNFPIEYIIWTTSKWISLNQTKNFAIRLMENDYIIIIPPPGHRNMLKITQKIESRYVFPKRRIH